MNQYTVQCPSCQNVSPLPPNLINQAVTCPFCGHQFIAQQAANQSSLPPDYIRSNQGEHATTATRRRSRSEESSFFMVFVDFFDPSFSRYVTPWIIRITWIHALLSTAAMIILAITGRFFSVLASMFGKITPGFGPPARPSTASMIGADIIAEGVGWIIFFSWLAISLLWLRVILEVCIVLFDISNTLKSQSKKA